MGVEMFIPDIGTGAGEERLEKECPKADPTGTSPSTAPPASGSPARISTDEALRTDDVPATVAAGNQSTTTEVAGEEIIPPQQPQSGTPSTVE
jgi:hypothetical protein